MKNSIKKIIFLCTILFAVQSTYAQCEKKATAIKWLQGKQDYYGTNHVINNYEIRGLGCTFYDVQWKDLMDVKITNHAKDPGVYTVLELITSNSNTYDENSCLKDYRIHYEFSVKNEMVQRVINALKDIIACNRSGEAY